MNKDNFKQLSNKWQRLAAELSNISAKANDLQSRRYEVIGELNGLLKKFEMMGTFPDNFVIPQELVINPKVTIGDFIEVILKEYGTLKRSEIEVYLRQRNAHVSLENARIVIANAIKRDTRCRFKVLKDGRVSLNKQQ